MAAYECYRLYSAGVQALAPSPLVSTPLPSSIVCPKGVYNSPYYGGFNWDMRLPGLYSLIRWPQFAADMGYANYRVVTGDPLEVCSAASYLCAHGTADEKLFKLRADLTVDWGTILAEASTRGLALLCGNTCLFASKLLTLASFVEGTHYRTVRLVTSGPPNYVDDGHVGLEIKLPGGWAFLDITFDRCFSDGAGGYLGAVDLVQAASPIPVRIAKDMWCHRQYGDGETTGFPSHAYHMTFDDVAWRNRVWHIPGIVQGGTTYCGIPPGRDSSGVRVYLQTLGYQVLEWGDWLTRFYSA